MEADYSGTQPMSSHLSWEGYRPGTGNSRTRSAARNFLEGVFISRKVGLWTDGADMRHFRGRGGALSGGAWRGFRRPSRRNPDM